MKILVLAQRIVFNPNESNQHWVTGYSYIMRDIISSLGTDDVQVDVLALTDEKMLSQYGTATILPRRFRNIISKFSVKDLFHGIQKCLEYKTSLRLSLTYLYYYASKGYVKDVIKRGNYDVINIQGLGVCGQTYLECCDGMENKIILSLHAFYTDLKEANYDLEKASILTQKSIECLQKFKGQTTVISSGMKKELLMFLPQSEENRISVINNGVEKQNYDFIDVRKKYSIDEDKKILLRVGNINKRKNQKELIEAIASLSEEDRKKFCVLLLGEDRLGGQLQNMVQELDLADTVIFCGNVNRNEVANYYLSAYGNIVNSIEEGFGLSMIEGFLYGTPSLVYKDLAAFDDVYSYSSVMGMERGSSAELANNLKSFLARSWNRNEIIRHSAFFSRESMVDKYREVCRSIV